MQNIIKYLSRVFNVVVDTLDLTSPIRYIITAPAKKIFSFDLPEESIREISLISKIYLNEKLELS